MEPSEELLSVDVPVEDEVLNFVTDPAAYCAFTGRGLRLDIKRTSIHQPPISDPDDFHTYMWVEAQQGYFLLSQHFLAGVPQRWVVYHELIPKDSTNFYMRYSDHILQYIEANPSHL